MKNYSDFEFSHQFTNGVSVKVCGEKTLFYYPDGRLDKTLTEMYGHLYKDYMLSYCCKHQTLIVEKDGHIFATQLKQLEHKLLLGENSNIKEISDHSNGFIAVYLVSQESIVYAGITNDCLSERYCGRVKFPTEDTFCVDNGKVFTLYNFDFVKQRCLTRNEVNKYYLMKNSPDAYDMLKLCCDYNISLLNLRTDYVKIRRDEKDFAIDFTKDSHDVVSSLAHFYDLTLPKAQDIFDVLYKIQKNKSCMHYIQRVLQ